MKILLIWPKSRNEILGWGDLGAIAEPLALEYLGAGARLDGHQVRLLDLRLHPDELETTIQEYDPDLVGITAFSMHVISALAICRRIKAVNPRCYTVAGGHHATFLPEDFFEPQIDFVVSGEGVAPFRSLLQALANHEVPAAIPGVWARIDGTFTFGGEQPPFNINDLPTPDRTLTERDRARYFIDWMKPIALVRTTVGCPYRCSFCSLWKMMDGRYFMREIDSVVAEMATIKEEFVFLVDDEAFINGPRMVQLAQALKAAGIHKRFFTYCRIDSLIRQRKALTAWREIGLERLFVGVDAISEKDLGEYNKHLKVSQIEEGFLAAKALDIDIFAQFVVNTDYTRRDFQQLIRFIEHHKIRYPSFTVLTPIPGTDMLSTFDNVIEVQPNGRPNWDLFDCQNAVTATQLPKREFLKLYRDLYTVFKGSYSQYREHLNVQTRQETVVAENGRRGTIESVRPYSQAEEALTYSS